MAFNQQQQQMAQLLIYFPDADQDQLQFINDVYQQANGNMELAKEMLGIVDEKKNDLYQEESKQG